MAAPRGGEWIAEEMTALRSLGVDGLVSMLTAAEERELDLEDERRAAEDAGLRYYALPTRDRETPDEAKAVDLIRPLVDKLRAGAHVAIHCRAGIGRSSLLAASVLAVEGVPPAEAYRRISAARHLAVPDTEAQRRFPSRWLSEAGIVGDPVRGDRDDA
ncbi:MAG: dual specificity protein phosphatase family protein [Micropruina sp.]|nr:MAG: dual specificity protein phosphatase family protein [Micropruina sp.]